MPSAVHSIAATVRGRRGNCHGSGDQLFGQGEADQLKEIVPPGIGCDQAVTEIQHAGLRAAALTRQLLAFSRKQALEQLATRVPCESVREFVGAVCQAEERGNPLGQVLEIQAEASRQRRSTRAEEAASTASVKMLAPMLLIFAAILLLIVAPMVMNIQNSFGAD